MPLRKRIRSTGGGNGSGNDDFAGAGNGDDRILDFKDGDRVTLAGVDDIDSFRDLTITEEPVAGSGGKLTNVIIESTRKRSPWRTCPSRWTPRTSPSSDAGSGIRRQIAGPRRDPREELRPSDVEAVGEHASPALPCRRRGYRWAAR